jgi:hypothetical protein
MEEMAAGPFPIRTLIYLRPATACSCEKIFTLARTAAGAQRAPEWDLAVRPSARDAPSPAAAAALVPDFQGATQCALWISSKKFCRGLTAPNGGIRSASSIGTIVRSSAVVVGQRSERGVP